MAFMDALWDDAAGILSSTRRDRHMTRETAWYALGLLQRGDTERASRALDRVIAMQFVEPGAPYHGTYRRAPEEADPPTDPVMWLHYDPNWRQFIGVTFALISDRYEDSLPSSLGSRLRDSIELAVDSEHPDRVSPTYANIALLKAWLDGWAGRAAESEAFAHDDTATSPSTARSSSTTRRRTTASTCGLWPSGARHKAWWPHWGPRCSTRCGATLHASITRASATSADRTYGMDMTRYATPLGLWIWPVVGPDAAPFPSGRIGHAHDFCFAPCIAAVEANLPADVLTHLKSFDGERAITQQVSRDPDRVVTAWLSDEVMLGGHAGPPSGIGLRQHHHATVHWRRPNGEVGWARMLPNGEADATITPGELRITSAQPITFELHPPAQVDDTSWIADGLRLRVETNASGPVVDGAGRITYAPVRGTTTLIVGVS